RVIGVNPIRSGYNAIADDWVGITPGTDGLFILSLIHELLRAGKIDLDYLARFTNAPVLINGAEGPEKGLFLRDENDKPLVIDRKTGKPAAFDQKGVRPDLGASYEKDGVTHITVMQMLAERYMDPQYSPDAVAETCGITAAKIRTIAAEIARVAFDEAFELDHEWT
ncbi:MAG TPA: formate dehydrogenase, partial [Roseovarius nubinhibens]|nr:formate dehydrogenase [Roseovarius nubinhibens]